MTLIAELKRIYGTDYYKNVYVVKAVYKEANKKM